MNTGRFLTGFVVLSCAVFTVLAATILPAGTTDRGSPPGIRPDRASGYGARVEPCAERFDWRRVGERADIILCIARNFEVPGGPQHMLQAGYCESGADLQDTVRDTYIGTYQHITTSWSGRWANLGRGTGVPDGAGINVLSQAVVTAKMVKQGGWGPWPNCGD